MGIIEFRFDIEIDVIWDFGISVWGKDEIKMDIRVLLLEVVGSGRVWVYRVWNKGIYYFFVDFWGIFGYGIYIELFFLVLDWVCDN